MDKSNINEIMENKEFQGKILIIDDDGPTIELLMEILSDEGYDTMCSMSGDEGARLARTHSPDLILLDIMMPRKNGFEICNELKSNQQTDEIPVIFISSIMETTQKIQGYSLGVVDYITKPFDEEEIKARIKNQIELSLLRKELKKQTQELKSKNAQLQNEIAEHQNTSNTLRLNISELEKAKNTADKLLTELNEEIELRKKNEAELKASEKKFRRLLEMLPIPVCYLTKGGEITFRNNKFLKILGYDEKSVPTIKEWWINACPEGTYREQASKAWENAIKIAAETDLDIKPQEYIVYCKDGKSRNMLISGIILNQDILICLIDITDEKKAEQEVKQLNTNLGLRVKQRTEELETANLELEAIVYSISHDLRAPLRHIIGFVKQFLDKRVSTLSSEELEYMDIVSKSAEEMGNLIDALLSYSRINRTIIKKQTIRSELLIQQVIKYFENEIKARKIELKVENLYEATGDQQLVQEVWNNLVSNAIKYTRKKENAKIEIGSYPAANEIVFFIKDNGAGFNMKYADKLFGVFQRLHKTRDFEGIGIGLANIGRIISRHGGRCWAESEVDKGATFYFTLPKED
jgi:PAS domain S-box-containing protein